VGGNKLVETIVKDPFLPPFTSLYVGEIIDEAEEQEYVILVRRASSALFKEPKNERLNGI
jgi:hypothetical protein